MPALAEKLEVVTTFSILGDLVTVVGGDRVAVVTLVGPDGDAHVFQPRPSDAKAVAGADLIVLNGLGFEGWIPRLLESAAYMGTSIIASEGIQALKMREEEAHHDDEKEHHGDEEEHHGGEEGQHKDDEHHHGEMDPHAWQSVPNVMTYVKNIQSGLEKADPANAAVYKKNAADYQLKLQALDAEIRSALQQIPGSSRRVITSHDAFGYMAQEYGVEFIAPQGTSTESEASAKDVASIIRQIRQENIRAVFVENISDPRLMEQISRETSAKVGGKLYSDALSGADEPAASYLGMMRHNVTTIANALK